MKSWHTLHAIFNIAEIEKNVGFEQPLRAYVIILTDIYHVKTNNNNNVLKSVSASEGVIGDLK